MSWQRILRFAKQRQVPVIITDESGEDPMILLSLDALEQALDGAGNGPDLPPVPPTPKSTTPSFIPELYEDEPSFVTAQPAPSFVPTPEPAGVFEEISPIVHTSEEITEEVPSSVLPEEEVVSMPEPQPAVPVEPEPIVIDDFELPVSVSEPQPPMLRTSEIEIMTPPETAPQSVQPVSPEKKEEEKPIAPISDAEPSAPKGISLEERFFIDF